MVSIEKKENVPLDEAINIAGSGAYTYYVVFTTCFLLFTGVMNIQAMAMVLPAAGCDLKLSSKEKGVLASMVLAGMLITGPISGFLADAYGRKRIAQYGQAAASLLLLLSSVAPSTLALMALSFANGIAATGSFTPSYVFVSEFCPQSMRAKALVIATCGSSLANIALPGLAWLIMPLGMRIPIFSLMTFTSWRLYLVILSIPMFLSCLFLSKIPETPKFLLNEGKSEETLEVLKTIYSINQQKRKEEYPVLSVVLDSSDEGYHASQESDSSPFIKSMKEMWNRTCMIFSGPFFMYTIVSCVLFYSEVGAYYTFMLWFPEQLSKIKQYSNTHDVYNVTLCNLLSYSSDPEDAVGDCQINYDFFSYIVILGCGQFLFSVLISAFADRFSKKLFLTCMLLLAGIGSSVLVSVNAEYMTITILALTIVDIAGAFPLILALVMDFYPTYARSTASGVGIIFGRLGASTGNQIMGILYEDFCDSAYFGISGILIVSALLCVILPSKKKFEGKTDEE